MLNQPAVAADVRRMTAPTPRPDLSLQCVVDSHSGDLDRCVCAGLIANRDDRVRVRAPQSHHEPDGGLLVQSIPKHTLGEGNLQRDFIEHCPGEFKALAGFPPTAQLLGTRAIFPENVSASGVPFLFLSQMVVLRHCTASQWEINSSSHQTEEAVAVGLTGPSECGGEED